MISFHQPTGVFLTQGFQSQLLSLPLPGCPASKAVSQPAFSLALCFLCPSRCGRGLPMSLYLPFSLFPTCCDSCFSPSLAPVQLLFSSRPCSFPHHAAVLSYHSSSPAAPFNTNFSLFSFPQTALDSQSHFLTPRLPHFSGTFQNFLPGLLTNYYWPTASECSRSFSVSP